MLLFCKVEAYKLKVTLLYGCFSRFLNCTNGAKSAKHHYAKILIDGIRKLLYEKKRLKNVCHNFRIPRNNIICHDDFNSVLTNFNREGVNILYNVDFGDKKVSSPTNNL